VIRSETTGSLRKVLLGYLTPCVELDAECFEEAMASGCFFIYKGVGYDEDALVELICGVHLTPLNEVKQHFQRKYHKTLESAITSEVKGNLRKLFLKVLEDSVAVKLNMETDVDALVKACNSTTTDEMIFVLMLTSRPKSYLKSLFEEFQSSYGEQLEEVIKQKVHGSLEVSMVSLIIRHVRKQDLMLSIKSEFYKLYQESLFERIRSETKGFYQQALLELVKP
ncbi:hypothetical protein HDU76_000850, partial [Blyttiomyces sp. JEL0837]